jgi:hypothetical protein
MNRVRDQSAALLLDFRTEWDVEPVAGSATAVELAGADPVVDRAGRDAEALSEVRHGDLAVAEQLLGAGQDPVASAQPSDGLLVEREPGAGAHPGGLELVGDLCVGVLSGEPRDQLNHLRWRRLAVAVAGSCAAR